MKEAIIPNIKQPYALTTSKHKLNVHEMRVIMRIVEKLQGLMANNIQKDLFGSLELDLETKTLLPEGSKNYPSVKAALKGLHGKTMDIRAEDEHGKYETTVGYLLQYKYYDNNSMIKITLPKELLSEYLELARGYTRYSLDVAFNSDSSYTMKIYQYISHWKDKSAITVDLVSFREMLGLEEKYSLVGHFKSRVLDPVCKELKEKGDIWFEYQDIKRGRKTTGFVFKIFSRSASEEDERMASAQEQNIVNMLRQHFDISEKDLKSIKPIIGKPYLQAKIIDKLVDVSEEIQKKRSSKDMVRNKSAYVCASILNEFQNL